MKNIAVGKRILLGFGAVILMIVLILGLTTLTSLTRSKDLTRVNTMTEMQREANRLLNNFTLARVEIRTVFTSIDAPDEYYLALDYLAAAQESLAKMDEHSAQLDNFEAERLAQLHSLFEEMTAKLVQVGDNDELALAAMGKMSESGLVMADNATQMVQLVTSIIDEMGAEDLAVWQERTQTVLEPIRNLNDTIYDLRIAMRPLLLLQDLTAVPEVQGLLDSVESQGAAIAPTLTSAEAKAALDATLAAAGEFRTSVDDANRIMLDSEAVIVDARNQFLELASLVEQCATAIADEVGRLNTGTITTSNLTTIVLLAVGVVAAVLAVLIAILLGRTITRPLGKMRAVVLQAGEEGDLNFSEEVRGDILKEAQARDEMGQSMKAFAQFVDRIVYISKCLESIANKDLTVDVDLVSEKDTMGLALRAMVNNLNEMFAEINSIASQVATASSEIAQGAQSLAQGSTEQASTVEEVSASINDINQQMTTSNQTATEAARQGREISGIAQQGNEKMSHMTGAMHDINEASQSIGAVIKVIDDIAFQTNILALNAAVEAARAGEHGKGFAVVADEVRNLAGKSADAAKETANLISANIEKTETGLSYTQETAESLVQIIDGINKTSESLSLVAEQSEAAQAATAQVTLAVDQVAQVVQQNSATSEQSAAASQQMSSQAQVLRQLVAQFRLRDTGPGAGTAALPAAGEAGEEKADIIF